MNGKWRDNSSNVHYKKGSNKVVARIIWFFCHSNFMDPMGN